jgi:hypothetical protein
MTNKEQFDTVLLARLKKKLAKARVTKSVREKGTKPYVVETKTQEEPMKHPNEREHLIRQLNQKTHDIVAPLRTLGQNVSAQFHCREHEQPCFDLTFFSLKEDQAKEIVRLLTQQKSARAGR